MTNALVIFAVVAVLTLLGLSIYYGITVGGGGDPVDVAPAQTGSGSAQKYKKLGPGFCKQGFMETATVDGKSGQTYRDVAPFNQSFDACADLCTANEDCRFMAFADGADTKDKHCAMYTADANPCSDRFYANLGYAPGNHVSYEKDPSKLK